MGNKDLNLKENLKIEIIDKEFSVCKAADFDNALNILALNGYEIAQIS